MTNYLFVFFFQVSYFNMTMYIMFVIDFNEKINYLSKYAIKIC